MREINNLKTRLSAAFEMKDLGPAKQILGMKISRDRSAGTLNLSQELYIEKTAEERDHMTLVPYASAVGSLMYAMVCTRPDIAHAMGDVSRYMANPGKEHWEAVKWLLRYLRGTSSTSLCFGKVKVTLQGFVDADLGGDVDSSKSTFGEGEENERGVEGKTGRRRLAVVAAAGVGVVVFAGEEERRTAAGAAGWRRGFRRRLVAVAVT
uniref:Reverse transcriptase Ty1/copia-type domain-containing protein n=1 Tax=Solanum lycopersicum TaxID=4081 RepID=A0A3Q7IHL4_SOLLC